MNFRIRSFLMSVSKRFFCLEVKEVVFPLYFVMLCKTQFFNKEYVSQDYIMIVIIYLWPIIILNLESLNAL